MMETIESWFDILRTIVSIRALYFVVFVSLILGVYWWARGILPAVIRLGNGLARRKIAIFAKNNHGNQLKTMLTESNLVREKNIFVISQEDDIDRAENASIYLVYWDDWKDSYQAILQKKKLTDALIIYAPKSDGWIPEHAAEELNNKPHTTVTNYRGRLLNDIVMMMITTGYQQK